MSGVELLFVIAAVEFGYLNRQILKLNNSVMIETKLVDFVKPEQSSHSKKITDLQSKLDFYKNRNQSLS